MLTHERLRAVIHYDPASGVWTWLEGGRGRRKDKTVPVTTRRRIKIDKVAYSAYRLAVFYMTGQWPEKDVDHKNRVPTDDRWDNLRTATRSQNIANTRGHGRSGIKGVSPHGNVWRAVLQGKCVGYAKTKEEAAVLYAAAAKAKFGDFAHVEGYSDGF